MGPYRSMLNAVGIRDGFTGPLPALSFVTQEACAKTGSIGFGTSPIKVAVAALLRRTRKQS